MKNMKSIFTAASLPLIAFTSAASAAQKRNDKCAPTPPAPCYSTQDDCCQYCLGPENVAASPAVGPKTCDGDFVINVAGFYWNAHQDGMEYAIQSDVTFSGSGDRGNLNNLINAEYLNPNFKWNWGFKAGLAYTAACDGWDFGVLWTWYQGRARDKKEAEVDDNKVLLPLWSASPQYIGNAGALNATDIESKWKLSLNLVDIELGRQFWVSKYLTLRPHLGVRVAYISQDWDLEHSGGSWSLYSPTRNNFVEIDNNYKGAGLIGGLDTVWNLCRGFAIFGNGALSMVYGRFDVKHDEYDRLASPSFEKVKILETKDSFRATRFITDLSLGLQWSTMFCECKYGFTIGLAWEMHLFLDQNQMWRVNRIGETADEVNSGENVYAQRRGDLDTQGVTLNLRFEF